MSVYVIECAGLLKIGYSENPEQRTARLFQSDSRYSAPRAAYEARGTQQLLLAVDGNKHDEAAIHDALDDYAIGCEWFVHEPEVLGLIRSFRSGDQPARLVRPQGLACEQVPAEEQGGRNHGLALQVLTKRRARFASP